MKTAVYISATNAVIFSKIQFQTKNRFIQKNYFTYFHSLLTRISIFWTERNRKMIIHNHIQTKKLDCNWETAKQTRREREKICTVILYTYFIVISANEAKINFKKMPTIMDYDTMKWSHSIWNSVCDVCVYSVLLSPLTYTRTRKECHQHARLCALATTKAHRPKFTKQIVDP